MDMMDERAFHYALHGGKAKDDPYFKDYFRPADFIDMEDAELEEDDIENLKYVKKYLNGQ